jgi:type I restriction enzyme S subunit
MANEYVDAGTPFLRSQDILPFRIVDDGSKFITPEFNAKLKKSELRAGDVAIVRTGFPGTAAVVPQRLDRSNCADLVIATPGPELNPWFLACLMNSAWGKGTVSGVLVGVAQQHFNVGAAKEMRFRCPPIAVQDRIADILSAYDDLIENNTRRIAILEDMARRLFEAWFGNGADAVWQTVKLGQVAAINPESIKPKSPPARIGYIDIASVSPGKVDQVQWMNFTDAPGRARRIVRDGDVIWSNVRPNRRSFALLLNVEQDTVASTGFSVLRAKAVPWSYLYVATTTFDFSAYLTNRAKGSAYPAVGSEDFADADVLLPDDETLERFHVHVGQMLELAARLNVQSANLRTTRDLLLPKLISGEIEVRAAEEALEAAAA